MRRHQKITGNGYKELVRISVSYEKEGGATYGEAEETLLNKNQISLEVTNER